MGLSDLIRRWNTPCAGVAGALPAYVAGEAELDERTAEHVAHCLRCQAEIARYRRMLRTLRSLRDDAEEPPPSVLSGILSGVDRDPAGLQPATVIAVVAVSAATAGAAAALLWAGQRRRLVR